MQHASLRADTEGEHRQIPSGRPRGKASPSASRRAVKPVHDTVLRAGPGLELGQPSRRLGVFAARCIRAQLGIVAVTTMLPKCTLHGTRMPRRESDHDVRCRSTFELGLSFSLRRRRGLSPATISPCILQWRMRRASTRLVSTTLRVCFSGGLRMIE